MCVPDKKQEKPVTLFTREEIKERALKSQEILIIFKSKVYNLTKWAKYHPGGYMAVFHLAGKDATDAITAFHPDWVMETRMPHFQVGELVPEQRKVSKISEDYQLLDQQLRKEGLYKTDMFFYVREAAKFFAAWALAFAFMFVGPTYMPPAVAYLASCSSLAFLWHQAAFVAHDAGHSSIFHNSTKDVIFGIFLADFFGGLSLGWWKDSHNVHHIVTNSEEHDPDIQHLPFFAVSTRLFNNLYSTYHKRVMEFDDAAKIFVSIQDRLYYIILLFGRFNLYVNSWMHLLKPRVPFRSLEIVGMAVYWSWYTLLLSQLPSWGWILGYVFLSHALTAILHVQITLSHFGMPTGDIGDEEFAAMGLRTSMDVDCPWWLDWFHGGLQFQVGHHLFPRIPRTNLRRLRPYIAKFAKDHGLEYHNYGFIKGNGIVLGVLRDVANHAHLLAKASKPHRH